MTALALKLAGPLQAWGSGSRFVRRGTERAPTKSGVLGLVAAAKGIRRTDPLTELLGLRFGVRVDQSGELLRDFQTARRAKKERDGSTRWVSLPLSYRYYLSDAVFVAVLEGERSLIEGIDAAVRSPAFPLYLGRRSCPPAGPVVLDVFDGDVETVLHELPWQASEHVQRRHRERTVQLDMARDAADGELADETMRDEPVSFDPNRRLYAWRSVVRGAVHLENPFGVAEPADEHDPMSVVGGPDVPD